MDTSIEVTRVESVLQLLEARTLDEGLLWRQLLKLPRPTSYVTVPQGDDDIHEFAYSIDIDIEDHGCDYGRTFVVVSDQLILLATAIAHVLDGYGTPHRCRILCDPGSQVSLMAYRFFNQLAIRRRPCTVRIDGVGSITTHTRGRAIATLTSSDRRFKVDVEFYLLDTITSPTPAANIASSCWQHLRGLPLADPSFGETGRNDALIGADIWSAIVKEGIVCGSTQEPLAQSTAFGWVVFGPATIDDTIISPVHSLQAHVNDRDISNQRLEKLVRLFFEMDGTTDSPHEDNDACERIFMETHHRDADGRYVVQIPFRPDASVLGNSHQPALRQFLQLEKRLAANPELKSKYIPFMREYEELGHMTVLTYGMASGPYNAIRAMQQCAKDHHGMLPNASRAAAALESILRDFYVDDYLASIETSEQAVELAGDIGKVLQQGHFHLRKWRSNDGTTLVGLKSASNSTDVIELKSPEITVLGLHWNPTTHELLYRIRLDRSPPATKRQVLSESARLYDPTNMCAPVIIVAKLFIQTLWQHGLEWDAPLPQPLLQEWLTFRTNLPRLEDIQIPRCLGMRTAVTPTLHGFCDASQKAYAAVIYLCSTNSDGQFTSMLVTSKTRVASAKLDKNGQPLATIPRLELCAARLLVELFNSVRQALALMDALWSDSSIVLCWLRKSVATLKQYAANRVAYIQQHSAVEKWRHVRTHLNPADCASRGILAETLVGHELWWHGPIELMQGDAGRNIPTPSERDVEAMAIESKPVKAHVGRTSHPISIQTRYRHGNTSLTIDLLDRFSQLGRLLRTTAYVFRGNPTRRHCWHRTVVDSDEMATALNWHIRAEQDRYFDLDLFHLKQNRYVPTSSKLASLAPYLDPDGIIRVGGRLRHSALPPNQRNPIILPKDSQLSRLIVRDIHLNDAHADVTLMLQTLRKRYWIISGRALVKQCVHNCVICRRQSQQMAKQQMASLPASRVLASPPFSSSGVDYCGPFSIRIGTQRTRTTSKTYVAIFICMATKAVHIELAENLFARAFLNVYSRFTSRRGPCHHLYSDNGTQFKKANKILLADLADWRGTYAQQQLANRQTKWHFISAAAPHQGGLWEAAVKSAKRHLVRVVGSQTLYYDQLHTLLVRIEACLNSRPLVALPTNHIHHWKLLRQMHQAFWQRWQDEYLVALQQRSKWRRASDNLRLGDIVVLRHENLPPAKWRLVRIVEVHPGSDGLVRNVTVEYHSTDEQRGDKKLTRITRPAQKVCRLISNDPEPTGPAGQ